MSIQKVNECQRNLKFVKINPIKNIGFGKYLFWKKYFFGK